MTCSHVATQWNGRTYCSTAPPHLTGNYSMEQVIYEKYVHSSPVGQSTAWVYRGYLLNSKEPASPVLSMDSTWIDLVEHICKHRHAVEVQ